MPLVLLKLIRKWAEGGRSHRGLIVVLCLTNIVVVSFFLVASRSFIEPGFLYPSYAAVLGAYLALNVAGLVLVLRHRWISTIGLTILASGSFVVTVTARLLGEAGPMAICVNAATITVCALLYGWEACAAVAALSIAGAVGFTVLEKAGWIYQTGFPPMNAGGFCFAISVFFTLVAAVAGHMSHLVKRREREVGKLRAERHYGTVIRDKDRKIAERDEALGTIDAIGSILVSIADVDLMLNRTLKLLTETVGGTRASVMLYDEPSNTLVVQAGQNLPPTALQKRVRIGEGIAGRVAQKREGIVVNEGEEERKGSFMSVPLLFQDKLQGVINVSDESGRKHFLEEDFSFIRTLAYHIAVTLENAASYRNLSLAYGGTISALARAIESKDLYTRGHSDRVTRYAVELAIAIGVTDDELKLIRNAGILHDIGKIGIPEAILTKPSRLTDEEFAVIKRHPEIGEQIVNDVPFLKPARGLIRHHHERFGGGGYPDGIAGNAIELGSRILAVADSFDAMTSNRAYRNALSIEKALAELEKCSGMQFDPDLVRNFLRVDFRSVTASDKD